MSAPQVIQGPWQELSRQAATQGSKQLTLVIPSDDAPETFKGRTQPEVVRTAERLVELLLEGLASPGREMTKSDIADLSERLTQRLANRSR